MESTENPDSQAARKALRGTAEVRANLSTKVTAPWWYHWSAALATAAVFIGTGMTMSPELETPGSVVLVLGAIIGPVVLLSALRSSTGVAFDRYASGMGWWMVIVFGLFLIALPLQAWGSVPYALLVAGVLAGLVTLWRERCLDRLIRARVHGEVRDV